MNSIFRITSTYPATGIPLYDFIANFVRFQKQGLSQYPQESSLFHLYYLKTGYRQKPLYFFLTAIYEPLYVNPVVIEG